MIELLLVFLSFIPGMHPNNYCAMFNQSDYIGYIIGFTMLFSLLSVLLFYSSSDSIFGPILGKMFNKDKNLFLIYILLFIIGAAFGVGIGQLYEIMKHLKNYKYFIYVLTIFLIFYIIINKDLRFIIGLLISGLWGIMVIDEKYMFHIFSGMFGLVFILLKLTKFEYRNEIVIDNSNSILYFILGIVIAYLSLIFPGISSPSIFGALFVSTMNIYYYATYMGFQFTASVYYYMYTGNVRNGYVKCLNSETKLFEALIGMIIAIPIMIMIKDKIKINEMFYVLAIIIILTISYILEGWYGLIVTLGSALVSYLNIIVIKSSIDANMGVVIIPTVLLITGFLLN